MKKVSSWSAAKVASLIVLWIGAIIGALSILTYGAFGKPLSITLSFIIFAALIFTVVDLYRVRKITKIK